MKIELINKLNSIVNNTISHFNNSEALPIINMFNEKATLFQITEVDFYFNNSLPIDYIYFLNIFNGCTLFKFEDISGFKFFSSFELIKRNKYLKENMQVNWKENIIVFCSCLGDGDYIGFKIINEYKYELLDCFGEEIPENWRTIGNSFDDFLEELIDKKGEKFWL